MKYLNAYYDWSQGQERTWWCWNATTVSVARHYNQASDLTQCELARRVINSDWGAERRTLGQVYQCCPSNDAATENCNMGWWPDKGPLQTAGHCVLPRLGVLSMPGIIAEIDANHPIVVDIQWGRPSRGGHIVVILGYLQYPDSQYVMVHDPGDNSVTWMAYEAFRDVYHGDGWWNATMKTQP